MKELDIENKLPHPSEKLKEKTVLEKLCEIKAFDYSQDSQNLFVECIKYTAKFQLSKSEFIKKYYKLLNFKIDSIKKYEDLDKLPFVFVNGFKERELTTLNGKDIVLELKSSGTSGQRSRIMLDVDSLVRVRRMAYNTFDSLGLADIDNVYDYICLTYDPNVAKDVGTAWTDKLLTSFTKKEGEVYYAFKWDDEKNNFFFDIENSLIKLREYEEKKSYVRIIGFPAFALKLAEEYKKKFGRYPRLNPKSFVITGGGWKSLEDEAIDKKIYRQILADSLSIPVENIRDLFGMVEHGVAYVDCKSGNFHIPVYGKVISREPICFKNLGYNHRGLLQFMTPYLTSYPSFSILSSDWGVIREGCDCGLKGPILEIQGRAGVRKLKGCAISASEMLK
jgi:phenylacetate-coenzyme A ligase PaaK-like adenylate-forming protein